MYEKDIEITEKDSTDDAAAGLAARARHVPPPPGHAAAFRWPCRQVAAAAAATLATPKRCRHADDD